MKLQPQTLSVLKSFAAINNGIWIKASNVLTTTNHDKTILATATIPDTFPSEFGIYDLNQLLSVLSLHKEDVVINFDEQHVLIGGKSGRSQIKYRFTDKRMLTVPPDKEIKLPSVEIEFVLEEEDYNWVMNAAKVLQSPDIAVRSNGGKMSLVAYNMKDDSTSTESLEIGDGNGDTFNMIFHTDVLSKIIPDTYNVKISSSALVYLENEKGNINYIIALDEKSSYN